MRAFIVSLTFNLLIPANLFACTVCFGNPESPTTKAAKAGILFLLGVTVCVLAGFGFVFLKWMKKAEELENQKNVNFETI